MPRQEEMEIALRDSISPGLKAIARELKALNQAAREAASGTTQELDNIEKRTKNLSESSRQTMRNMEVRVTKSRIEFRDGDTVVGYYDKQNKRWSFTGEMRLGDDNATDPIYGVNKDSGKGQTTDTTGSGSVLIKTTKPGPPTSGDINPWWALIVVGTVVCTAMGRQCTMSGTAPSSTLMVRLSRKVS